VWTATAGTFSTGSTSAQVTWVPPQTIADYSLTVTISDGKSSVDTTIQITVSKAVYNLSGVVRNQAGVGADAIYVVITDSDAGVDSVLTDASGSYSFTEKPEGATSVTLRSAAVAFNRLPRYIQKDTTVSLTNTAVINLGVQELQAIYDDDGTNAGQWTMYGGVRTDGSKYIFKDDFLLDDHMVMTAAYPVPSYAQDIGILVHGVASPSDSGLVHTTIYKDGVNAGHADGVYYTSGSWMWVSLSTISGLPSSNVHLDLEFFTSVDQISYPATSVSIDTILIYNY